MNLTTAHIFRLLTFLVALPAFCLKAEAKVPGMKYERSIAVADTNRFPLSDRRSDPYTSPNRNSFDLRDTGFIKRSVEYDPKTNEFFIVERVGSHYYRTPVAYSRDEFLRLQGEKDEKEYFRKRAALLANLNRRLYKPKPKMSNDWFNRIMGVGAD